VKVKAFHEKEHEETGEKDGKEDGNAVKEEGVVCEQREKIRGEIRLAEPAEHEGWLSELVIRVPRSEPCLVFSHEMKIYLRDKDTAFIGKFSIGYMSGVRGNRIAHLDVVVMRIDNLAAEDDRGEKNYVDEDKEDKGAAICHVGSDNMNF